MALPPSLTTVTRFSKTVALILFIALPFLGFLLGMRWQEVLDSQNQQFTNLQAVAPHPTPTMNISANWKTYINTKYNFSVDYPERLSYSEDLDPTYPVSYQLIQHVPTVTFSLTYEETKSSANDTVMIRVFDKTKASVKEVEKSYFGTQDLQSSWNEVEIGGYKGQYTKATSPEGIASIGGFVAILEKAGNIYYFHLSRYRSNKIPISDQEFFMILLTFKFLN